MGWDERYQKNQKSFKALDTRTKDTKKCGFVRNWGKPKPHESYLLLSSHAL